MRRITKFGLLLAVALAALVSSRGVSFAQAPRAGGSQVVAWGYNYEGELGNGSFTPNPPYGSATPLPVSGLTGVVAIAGGYFHSLALRSDGTVWTWGRNYEGQLGSGRFSKNSPYGSATPVPVSGLTGVVAIAGGHYHSLALTSEGTVGAWGQNSEGELGIGSFTTNPPYGSAAPVQVSGLTGMVAV